MMYVCHKAAFSLEVSFSTHTEMPDEYASSLQAW